MTRIAGRLTLLAWLVSLVAAGPALADSFTAMPTLDAKKQNDLQIRFVRYDGSTNGAMVVEIRNKGKRTSSFSAEGLFFVPTGDPEKAPQRLGAAGPFVEIASSGKGAHKEKVDLRPGETKQLALEVFCIDSHRASPNSNTRFTVAKKRMPKQLRQEVSAGSKQIIKRNKGSVSKSKSAIQSHMWQTRDKKWIKLEGERKNEKAVNKSPIQMRNVQMRNNRRPVRQKRRIQRNVAPE